GPRAGQTRLGPFAHLPPPQAPAAGTKSSPLSPGAKRGGKGPAVRRVGGGPRAGQTRLGPFVPYLPPPQAPAAGTFPHFVGDKAGRVAPTSRLRKLRRQGPSPTSWGT